VACSKQAWRVRHGVRAVQRASQVLERRDIDARRQRAGSGECLVRGVAEARTMRKVERSRFRSCDEQLAQRSRRWLDIETGYVARDEADGRLPIGELDRVVLGGCGQYTDRAPPTR
jgi:hypothetical protein